MPIDDETSLCGLDLDSIITPRDGFEYGEIESIALEVLSRFGGYAEISPSGEGVKVFFLVKTRTLEKLKADGLIKTNSLKSFSRGSHQEIAIAWDRKYFTVTGEDIRPGGLVEIGEATLRWLLKDAGPRYEKGRPRKAKEPNEASGPIDRSAAVIGYVVKWVRERLADGELLSELYSDDCFAAISQMDIETDKDDATVSWVLDQMTGGDAGERQMDRAFERVVDNPAKFDLFDADNPPFEDLGEPAKKNSYVDNLNSAFGHITINGMAMVIGWRENGDFDLFDLRSFASEIQNLPRCIHPQTGQETTMANAWLSHPKRRKFSGLSFNPAIAGKSVLDGQGRRFFNICSPWQVSPIEGGCSPVLDVLRESVCAGNEGAYEWLLDYLAHMIQKPEERPSIHPILFGGMGSGKDGIIDLMSRILPNNSVTDMDFREMIAFNSNLKTALLVNVPEAVGLNTKTVTSKLKHFMTSLNIDVNEKFKPLYRVPFYARVFFTTNDITEMQITPGDRRYVPIESGTKWLPGSDEVSSEDQKAFWERFWEGFVKTKDGPSMFMKFLMDRNILGFEANRVPAFCFEPNSLRSKMLVANLAPEDEVWVHVLSNPGEHIHENKDGKFVIASDLVQLAEMQNMVKDRFKRSHRTARQWTFALSGSKNASIQVKKAVKIKGKTYQAWFVNIDLLREKLTNAYDEGIFEGDAQ